MKILHVVHGLGRGGLERGVVNLLNLLPQQEFEQAVCCLDYRGEMAEHITQPTRIFELGRKRHDLRLPFRLANIIQQWHPDIIHCRNWNTWADTVMASKIAKITGCSNHSIVWSFHGFSEGHKMPARRRVASYALAHLTNNMVAVCNDSAIRYADQTNISVTRFTTLYNGVDCNRFAPSISPESVKTSLGISSSTLLALTVASLTPVKNHLGLLEAIAQLPAVETASVHFLFLGEGPLRAELEATIQRLGIGNKVTIAGASDRIPEYLQAADFFILPSHLEGMSNAILEAMASGLPVIAQNVGGNTELILSGITGLLCQPGNSKHLTDAILQLIQNQNLRMQMGLAAREQALSQFSISAMISNYSEFYRKAGSNL